MTRLQVTKRIGKQNIKRTRTIAEAIKEGTEFVKQADILQVKKKKEEVAREQARRNEAEARQAAAEARRAAAEAARLAQQQLQQQQIQQQQRTNLIKRNSSTFAARGKFREEDAPKYLHMEHLREGVHELDEHHNFKERFLGREGMFTAYKVIVGCFYDFTYYRGFEVTAGEELKKRGFSYDLVTDENRFLDTLMNYDIAWIISSHEVSSDERRFAERVTEFMKAKKSLFLWVDNTPFTAHANAILKANFDGMFMEGDYEGGKTIQKSAQVERGTFDESHSIAYGLNNLHEGLTIARPEKTHADFKVFAHNSNDEPMILYADENENHGRIIIDTGFTKLFQSYWTTAGTHQYVSNANVWLTGIPL